MAVRQLFWVIVFFFCMANYASVSELHPLRVGVVGEEPFVTQKSDGQFDGFAIALWEASADKAGVKYGFVQLGSDVDKALDALANGQVDVVVGPVSVTTPRLAKADFSRPFYINTLAVVLPASEESFINVVTEIVKPFLRIGVLIWLILLLIFGIVHGYFEARDTGSRLTLKLFLESLWNVAIAIFTLGYPDFPKSVGARINSVFCALTGLIFATVFSAAAASAMTISSSSLTLEKKYRPKFLRNQSTLVMQGSFSERLVPLLHGKPIAVSSFAEGISKLRAGEAAGFLDDYLTIKYTFAAGKYSDLSFSPFVLGEKQMAFAFVHNSQEKNKIDRALISIQDSNEVFHICARYLDEEDANRCVL